MSNVSGVKEMKAAIKVHKNATAEGVEKGLTIAGLALQRESQKVVPVDTGVLRASASTLKEGKGMDTEVRVGYGTDYGIYVHEDLNARHKPGKTAKYLERPLRENRKRLARIVQSVIAQHLPT